MFKVHVLLLIAVSLAMLTGCLGEIDHRQALIDTREACGVAIASGETERIFSCWTEDVVIYPVSEPAVKGIDAVKAYVFRNRQELGIRPKLTPLEFAASSSGDLGYIVGTHEWLNREGQATMPGRYVTLWRKNEQGEWKCFLEIHSPRPAEEGENVMSDDEASGTLQPSDSPLEQPVRIDAGESCIVDLTQSYTLSGSLSGTVVFNYRILVKGPCGSPLGTYDEEWIAFGEFDGKVNDTTVLGNMSYVATVKAGGAVDGQIVMGQGIEGELHVSGNFKDGKLSYKGLAR